MQQNKVAYKIEHVYIFNTYISIHLFILQNGSTIQYSSVLKTKLHESYLQCVTNFKHEY